MEIEAAFLRRFQNLFRQQQAIGNNNRHISIKITEPCLFFRILQRRWREYRDTESFRRFVHGRFLDFHSTPGLARLLGVTRDHVMPLPDDFHKGGHGKLGSSHKDDA